VYVLSFSTNHKNKSIISEKARRPIDLLQKNVTENSGHSEVPIRWQLNIMKEHEHVLDTGDGHKRLQNVV